jgi:hypothetical protein
LSLVTYDLTKPCGNCPFKKTGGVRLMWQRVLEVAGNMLSNTGGEFPCHKTTETSADGESKVVVDGKSVHCAGALIFAEKQGRSTQMMRLAERFRIYDPRKLTGHEEVFDDLGQMLATAYDAEKRIGRKMVKKIAAKPVERKRTRR